MPYPFPGMNPWLEDARLCATPTRALSPRCGTYWRHNWSRAISLPRNLHLHCRFPLQPIRHAIRMPVF